LAAFLSSLTWAENGTESTPPAPVFA